MSQNGSNEDVEKAQPRLARVITPGGHPADFSQPSMPLSHRKYGNPVPIGLTSFGCGFFLASALTLYTRQVHIPNMVVPIVMRMVGNVPRKYILGYHTFGVIQAYQNADGTMKPEFNQAVGLYMMAWMMVTILFILGALRSSLAVLLTLVFTGLTYLTLGIYYFYALDGARIAGGVFGMLATAAAWWAAMSGFWHPDSTFAFIRVGPIDLSPKKRS
ncbi:hypothetical protein TREMEDRAFT_65818 [Tremella mesenterica DSM 1558]|uniref:uncharacterized protein n=1 Tax=Tremella mesenterica (strain ATCC 24925 / CBS 8224 / DSM 1558 / NBRC 9311 / NRRL Y-6157 / RJB 2259-6 / UBC 559-6) TaxID=578456 RepID=UPI00032CC4B5|nr:uncharacterized protein TREMEDRAFT_65818 [Tremella mesenterica DSM 1558]EIW66210.1 hypothetical protein TREMEDRAFT_65818 [Tremella mesenterica DSM 1558]